MFRLERKSSSGQLQEIGRGLLCCDDSVVPSVATSYPEHVTIYRVLQHAIHVVKNN